MGNTALSSINVSAGSKCIGKIANEKNDKLYWFISAATPNPEPGELTVNTFTKDIIAEYDHATTSVKPVVVDLYRILLPASNINAPASPNQLSLNNTLGIRAGMTVTGRSSSGRTFVSEVESITGNTVTLTSNITFGATIELIFEAERALNFNQDFLITGINIIDDLLSLIHISEPTRPY